MTTILVAEDEPTIRMLIVDVLEDAGFVIVEACDGEEAIRLLHDADGIDIVVTDINMPFVDGFEVAYEARKQNDAMPILYISGRPNGDRAWSTLPPRTYLRKPFALNDLVATVNGLLGERPGPVAEGA